MSEKDADPAGHTSLTGSPTARLEVLDASVLVQRRRWIELWQSWSLGEPMAHPDYVRLVSRDVDQAMCAAMSLDDGGVLFPFVLRPLAAEEWARTEPYFDLVTPYGFGGAYRWSFPESLTELFWDTFDAWAVANRVVTSVARLSLFPEDLVPFRGQTREVSSCVVRTLEEELEAIWKSYEHKVRKNVNRARRSSLSIDLDLGGSRLEDFLSIYNETMERRNAGSFYRFSRSFFNGLFDALPRNLVLVHVSDKNRVVSTELLLLSGTRVYSFLGGTRQDSFASRPNDFLKHEVVRWAKEEGKELFVLGGGERAGDGIFRYKKSFAPQGVVPFYIGTRVYDTDAFDHLVELRDGTPAPRLVTRSNYYFPPYRA